MRLPVLALAVVVVVVGACGPDDGAVLTIHAPDGPGEVGAIEIVLANASAEAIGTADQRVMPQARDEAAVRYYRWRASGGFVGDVARLDGFVVRIEREPDVAEEEQFIPFVLAYDNRREVIGIGAVLDPAGDPMPVTIAKGETTKYTVELTPLAAAAPDAAIGAKERVEVECSVASLPPFLSGIAWQPVVGPQLRLLMPTIGLEGERFDASNRSADVDCDGRVAGDGDCDDLRREFHEDVDERCDGLDTNCDGRAQFTQECLLPAGVCGPAATMGVQLCVDDVEGGHESACRADVACACAAGNPGPCRKCVLDFEVSATVGRVQTCAPAIGKIKLVDCANGCRVQVVSAAGPWKAQVANAGDGAFGSETTTAGIELFLRVKAEENPIPATPAQSVGAVYLAVTGTQQNTPEIVAIDLETGFQPTEDCVEVANGDFAMSCSE